MPDIVFSNCSVGVASAAWMEDLGALAVCAEHQARIADVVFRNIEIYKADQYPINVTLGDNAAVRIDRLTFSDIRIENGTKIRVCSRSTTGGSIDGITFTDIARKGKKGGQRTVARPVVRKRQHIRC